MKIFLASPRGFCSGVKRAISLVEESLEKWGPPIYVNHPIVHNRQVILDLEKRGVVFCEDLSLLPQKSVLIFSAHGVGPGERKKAKALDLQVIDATCPLVTRLHTAVIEYAKIGYHILLIGNKNHAETIGVWQEAPNSITIIESIKDCGSLNFDKDQKLVNLCQTTFNISDRDRIAERLKEKFPQIESYPSICFSTILRQKSLVLLASFCELALVVGDQTSSNCSRLVECAQRAGAKTFLITCSKEIDPLWLTGVKNIALTSGASTPSTLVDECIERLKELGVDEVIEKPESAEMDLFQKSSK